MEKKQSFHEIAFYSLKEIIHPLRIMAIVMTLGIMQLNAIGASIQQQLRITGTITDAGTGQVMPGVNVVVKGTTIGTISDGSGKYSIETTQPNAILVFSFIGYVTQEVPVAGRSVIDVALLNEVTGLQEVVVIGYGTQKKSDLTGSIASIKADKLLVEKPQAIQDILRGNIAGLEVGFSTSAKGGGSLEIRGENSLKTSSYPLIVLDGVIYPGALEDINPYDIQTIDVLKDASSAAVYGARSANGVILITTTKKGTQTRPTINFNSSIGLATIATKPPIYDPWEFIEWRREMLRSTNRNTAPANTKLYLFDNPNNLPEGVTMDMWLDGKTGDPIDIWLGRLGFGSIELVNYHAGKYVDWEDLVYQTGFRQDHNLSIAGQKEETTYYWSIGYNDNEGFIVGDMFKTIRSRLNLESKVTDWITVGLNSQFASRDESGVPAAWGQSIGCSPWGSFYKDDGVTIRWSPLDEQDRINPLYDMTFTDRKRNYTTFNNNLYGTIKLPLGITYQIVFAPLFEFYENLNHYSAQHYLWGAYGGQATREQSKIYSWQIDNLLKWNKTINVHQIDVTLLANAEKYQRWQNYMSAQGFSPSDVLGYHNISVGKSATYVLTSDDQYSTGDALMARLFYSLMSRYMLTLSIRRDGYSAFGLKNPYGVFPAMAVAWVFTDESFLNNDFFYGKLRLSWGQNGNREIGRYDALSDMGIGKQPYVTLGGVAYENNQLYVNRMSNPNLKWEKTQSINIGLDFSFKKGLVDGSIEVYDMHTKDLLVDRKLPDITGFTSVASNLGEIQNKGFELNLNARIIAKENLLWRSNLTFSLNRNKVLHLYGDMVDVTDESGNVIGQREADDITNRWFIGQALDRVWDPEVAGIWQIGQEAEAQRYAQYPGDFHIIDVDDDGKITQLDNVFQGYTEPRFRWNMRHEFNILKAIDFSFNMYSYWGHVGNYSTPAKHNPKPEKGNEYNYPFWTPENPINDYARIRTYSTGEFNVWREKSFIRLDRVSLSYTVPSALCTKMHIKDLKFYGNIQNAALWSPHWDFWDPEYSGPNPRYFTLGINLTL